MKTKDFDKVTVRKGKIVTSSDEAKDKIKMLTFVGLKRELGKAGAKKHMALAVKNGQRVFLGAGMHLSEV